MDNRGKRSITIDLTHADGPELVRRLGGQADIFVTNLLPGRQERYGLTYEAMRQRFPKLIHVSVSGFGSIGPNRDKLGFDYSAFWASSGLMGLMGEPGTPPPVQRPGMGDHTTSLNVMAAVLAALRRRDQTGEGLSVDVSLFATGTWALSSDLSAAVVARKIPPRYSRVKPLNPIWNAYTTKDGRWLLLVMPHPNEYWPALCRALGRTEWIDDPRYNSKEKRTERNRELVDELDRAFGERTVEDWKARLDSEGIIWSAVLELPQVLKDPQAEHLGHFQEVSHPEHGPFRTLAAPFRILGADIKVRGPAPEIGQHTEEVLLEFEMDWDEIARLRESGVLG
jgi:formyl-CoA transferase